MAGAKKPKCKIVGTNSNVFALSGRVRAALVKARMFDRSQEFTRRLRDCHSYQEALQLMMEYVDVS